VAGSQRQHFAAHNQVKVALLLLPASFCQLVIACKLVLACFCQLVIACELVLA